MPVTDRPDAAREPPTAAAPRRARIHRLLWLPAAAGLSAAAVAVAVVLPVALTRGAGRTPAAPRAVTGPTAPPTTARAPEQRPTTAPTVASTQTVVAGNGKAGYSGDGGPATAAALNAPLGPAIDAAGNLYVPDIANDRIRKITPSGVITTVAGNGKTGFSGDGGPATAAALNGPGAVAVDAAGNLYIADTANHRVRRVDTHGIITTIAGTGDLVDSQSFALGPGNADLGDGGPATRASIGFPFGIAVDGAGNVVVGDLYDNRVRLITGDGTITTVAGGDGEGDYGDGGPAAQALLDQPTAVALDGTGRIYVADTFNHRIRRIGRDGTIETIAGTGVAGFSGDGGPARAAALRNPRGVAVDAAGDVFINDRGNKRIREVTAAGAIRTVAGTLPPGVSDASLPGLQSDGAMAVDPTGRALYVSDRVHNTIVRINLGG